jgi:hypothetical protein
MTVFVIVGFFAVIAAVVMWRISPKQRCYSVLAKSCKKLQAGVYDDSISVLSDLRLIPDWEHQFISILEREPDVRIHLRALVNEVGVKADSWSVIELVDDALAANIEFIDRTGLEDFLYSLVQKYGPYFAWRRAVKRSRVFNLMAERVWPPGLRVHMLCCGLRSEEEQVASVSSSKLLEMANEGIVPARLHAVIGTAAFEDVLRSETIRVALSIAPADTFQAFVRAVASSEPASPVVEEFAISARLNQSTALHNHLVDALVEVKGDLDRFKLNVGPQPTDEQRTYMWLVDEAIKRRKGGH